MENVTWWKNWQKLQKMKPISSDKKSKVQISLLTFCYRGKVHFPFSKGQSRIKFSYTNLYSHLNSSSIFHPPISILIIPYLFVSDSLWKPMRRSYGASYLRNYKRNYNYKMKIYYIKPSSLF
jgi:hypothetical protein